MEIYLANEQITYFVPRFTTEIAQDRVEQKKISLIAGTVGSLLSRPKADEINLISFEYRYDPYWKICAAAKTRFDRKRIFMVPVSGPDVQSVTLFGQETAVEQKNRDSALKLEGVEHCFVETRAAREFNALTGQIIDLTKYQSYPRTQVDDISRFNPEGAQVITPQLNASAVVRQVLSEVVKPAENAHVIHEERVDIETIELNFFPVYALEYEWTGKGKKGVIEFDALTGEITTGKKLTNQVKGAINRDLLFDLTADAAGILVPGGSIAVKLVKAVVDRNK